jgi:predicted DNA binding CopG/RHH family protein
LNEISDRLKGTYSNIEISVERLRTDINRNFQKEEELYDQIVEMEKRVFSERNKVATR